MKKLLFFILCLSFMTAFAACQAPNGEKSQRDKSLDDWLENANLDAHESTEQLYELAKGEDVLTVYSVSTRMMEVARAFEAEYEELVVNVMDLRGDRIISDAKATIDSGEYDCDILFMTDVNGVLSNDFVPNGYAYKYQPYDFADKLISVSGKEELMPLFTEAIFIHYNPALFPEQPIDNWWELTEERWRGKVYAPNPVQSVTTLAMYNMLIKNNEAMEQAYELHYGEVFTDNGESAAHTFIRRLVENELHIVNSSDEVSDVVGLNNTQEALGLMVSSKLRLKKIGYELEFATDVEPFDGVSSAVNIMIAGGAKNINTAKLFIRFIFGETNGDGAGYLPYLQEGVWAMRTDVKSEESLSLEELNLVFSDEGYNYEHQREFLDFWSELLQ